MFSSPNSSMSSLRESSLCSSGSYPSTRVSQLGLSESCAKGRRVGTGTVSVSSAGIGLDMIHNQGLHGVGQWTAIRNFEIAWHWAVGIQRGFVVLGLSGVRQTMMIAVAGLTIVDLLCLCCLCLLMEVRG